MSRRRPEISWWDISRPSRRYPARAAGMQLAHPQTGEPRAVSSGVVDDGEREACAFCVPRLLSPYPLLCLIRCRIEGKSARRRDVGIPGKLQSHAGVLRTERPQRHVPIGGIESRPQVGDVGEVHHLSLSGWRTKDPREAMGYQSLTASPAFASARL
jgi:hypothetical protein